MSSLKLLSFDSAKNLQEMAHIKMNLKGLVEHQLNITLIMWESCVMDGEG